MNQQTNVIDLIKVIEKEIEQQKTEKRKLWSLGLTQVL